MSPEELQAVKDRLTAWAASIRASTRREAVRAGLHDPIDAEAGRPREAIGDDKPHEGPAGRGSR